MRWGRRSNEPFNRRARAGRLLALTVAVTSLLPFARSQYAITARADLIAFTDGVVLVEDVPLTLPAGGNVQLRNGERVRTERGKAEVAMGPNIFLWLGPSSALTLKDSRLSDAEASLERGSAIVEVTEGIEGNRLSVRVGESLTALTQRGVYRFDASSSIEARLRVYGGQAEVQIAAKRASVKRDRAVRLAAGLRQSKFDRKKEMDDLYFWSAQRSFAMFKPVWQEARGKNWHITLTGTAVNAAFGAEVADASITGELLQKASEKRQIEEEAERIQQRQRQLKEAERKRQEAERQRQEAEERRKAMEKAQSKP